MLERIARFDTYLHSYAAVAVESARRSAAVATAEIERGRRRGPLHGIPLAVKDVFYTTDMPTGCGSPMYAGRQAPYESTPTRRLRAAGAVLLGKHTLTEGVYADHHPSVVPPVNPFGAAYWTGTSSSGSAVATTAGLCYGTLGTDTGGSIRLPSACCGLVGLKPTYGRVSRYGVFPLADSLDHVGPMARNAADAAVLLGAIAGADTQDPTAALQPVPDYFAEIDRGVAGRRIGIDRAFVRAGGATDAVCESLEAVAATMKGCGAEVVPVEFPDTGAVLKGWAVQCAAEAALAHRATYPARRSEYGERFAALLARGGGVTGLQLAEALRDRREFTGRVAQLFSAIDLLVLPVTPLEGPSLAAMAALGEDPAAILAIGPFTAPFDVCGYPAIALPCGETAAGIPLGIQFAGKPFSESLLLQAAHAYQRVTGWHERRPALEARA